MFNLGSRIRPVSLMRQSVRFNSTNPSDPQSLYLLDALRSSNKLNPQKKLNTNPLDILSSKSNDTTAKNTRSTKNDFKLFLSENELKAKPKDVANQLRITGPRAGKIIKVVNNDINGAFNALNGVVRSNNIRQDKRAQQFYIKPGKQRELKAIQRNKREFMKGFKRLMNIVKDASRKGY